MAPAPLEGIHSGPMGGVPSQPPGQGSVPLPLLIEFIIQKTYHDLTVLAELLPQKADMERKIAIVEFATRTRQLFVRLLALVKWAASACKVDKCASIMGFLDKQSHLFVDTADLLHRLSKDTLVNARMPNFLIPAAVEVLTTGSYPRLPSCIRDNIIPPDPITAEEKRTTLSRLNQIIQHRLVTTTLPPQMSEFKIANGRVKLRVDNEFEVSLTLMGDGADVPWRLLSVKILVEDKEIGRGKSLVHKMQVNYMFQIVQSRLVDHPKPLVELYTCLHAFCLSLQLEVLSVQTHALIRDRLGDLVKVEEYLPGKTLTISYWRELTAREPSSQMGFKLTVQMDPGDRGKPLSVFHAPPLPSDMADLAERAIKSEDLSIERLLVHTIHVRALGRLKDLKRELALKVSPGAELTLQGSPAVLSVPVLQPCLKTEMLLVSVETYSGLFLAHVPQYEPKVAEEIQNCLNTPKDKAERLDALLVDLRMWIAAKHIEKSLQHLPAACHERLPLLHRADHEITKLDRYKRFIRLHKHPSHILIAEIKDRPDAVGEVELRIYMMTVKPSSIEDDPQDDKFEAALPKTYLRVQCLVEFNEFVAVRGMDIREEYVGKLGRKRRRISGRDVPAKKPHYHHYHQQHVHLIPDIAHVVAMADERLVYNSFEHELTRRCVVHAGMQPESDFANCLEVIWMPPAPGVPAEVLANLSSRLASIRARITCRPMKSWIVEIVFNGSPVSKFCLRDDGIRQVVHLVYEVSSGESAHTTVDAFLREWAQIVRLYQLVLKFSEDYKHNFVGLRDLVKIKYYSYKRLVLLYGPGHQWMLTIQWSAMDESYHLFFGSVSGQRNPHALMSQLITRWFNGSPTSAMASALFKEAGVGPGEVPGQQETDLAHLVKLLSETLSPLLSLAKLSSKPHIGQIAHKPQAPMPVFAVVPESAFHVRVFFYSSYCVEVFIRGNGLVGIRDGAFSKFNWSRAVSDLTPIPMLKTFLNKFYDEAAVSSRRKGMSFFGSKPISAEDDNPPSPMTLISSSTPGGGHSHSVHMDALGFGLGSQQQQQQHFKSSPFPQPMTPPVVSSNPHTPAPPASPACSQMPPPGPSPAAGGAAGASLAPTSPFPPTGASPLNPMHWPGSPSVAGSKGSPAAGGKFAGHPSPGFGGLMSPQMHGAGSSAAAAAAAAAAHAMRTTTITRVLPPRAWAAAVPTLLTQEAFDAICSPPQSDGAGQVQAANEHCPLEKFLASVFLQSAVRRCLTEQQFRSSFVLVNADTLTLSFKPQSGDLQLSVFLNPETCQNLVLKATTDQPDRWRSEDLAAIEQYFEKRVVGLPPRLLHVQGFLAMLACPPRVFRDIVKIVKHELVPPAAGAPNSPRWGVHWCLTIPSSAPPLTTPGICAIIPNQHKHLFFLQLNRLQGTEGPPSVVVPLLYDNSKNGLSMPEAKNTAIVGQSVHQVFKRLSEFGLQREECTLYPAVRELMMTLSVGPDGVLNIAPQQPQPQQQQQQPQMQMQSQQPQQMMGNQGQPQQQQQQQQPPQQQQQMMNPQQQAQQQQQQQQQQPQMMGMQPQQGPPQQQQQQQVQPQQQQQSPMMGPGQQQMMQGGPNVNVMAPNVQMAMGAGGQMAPGQQFQRMMHPRMPHGQS